MAPRAKTIVDTLAKVLDKLEQGKVSSAQKMVEKLASKFDVEPKEKKPASGYQLYMKRNYRRVESELDLPSDMDNKIKLAMISGQIASEWKNLSNAQKNAYIVS